jgi:hypothetical protein
MPRQPKIRSRFYDPANPKKKKRKRRPQPGQVDYDITKPIKKRKKMLEKAYGK